MFYFFANLKLSYIKSFDVNFLPIINKLLKITSVIYFFDVWDVDHELFGNVWRKFVFWMKDNDNKSNLKCINFIPYSDLEKMEYLNHYNILEKLSFCSKETSKFQQKITLLFQKFKFGNTSELENLLRCVHKNNIKLFKWNIHLK